MKENKCSESKVKVNSGKPVNTPSRHKVQVCVGYDDLFSFPYSQDLYYMVDLIIPFSY